MSKFSRLCRVSVAALPCVFLRLRERSQSGGRAKAERRQSERCAKWEQRKLAYSAEPKQRHRKIRHSVKTNPRLAISRPFSNAKIVRNNDITNFFEQKMSLFPLLKKRGSLWYQKRLSLATRKRWLSRRKTCFLYFSQRKKWTYHKLFYAQQLKNTQNT